MSRRRCGGKLFHTRGPAALKLRTNIQSTVAKLYKFGTSVKLGR